MCKYSFTCFLCHQKIEIHAEQQNMNDVNIKIACDCPAVQSISQSSLCLDAIYETTVPKEKSKLYRIVTNLNPEEGCTLYDCIIDAVGRNLGRYYELV